MAPIELIFRNPRTPCVEDSNHAIPRQKPGIFCNGQATPDRKSSGTDKNSISNVWWMASTNTAGIRNPA